MPDVYATIAEADAELQEQLAGVLELRAADPRSARCSTSTRRGSTCPTAPPCSRSAAAPARSRGG